MPSTTMGFGQINFLLVKLRGTHTIGYQTPTVVNVNRTAGCATHAVYKENKATSDQLS